MPPLLTVLRRLLLKLKLQTDTNAWAILTGILVVTAVSAFVGLSISTGGTAAGLLYLAQKLFSSGALAVE
ncbi:hypothetical protein NRIC0767_03130 [Lactobacillus delbrueckii subsp. allosunkii]|jgi:hypothetical protein|nr:hypothetical protein LS838_00670 [Lactobacillus delbrueckii subsp. sunkii]GHN13372.1 hypothetical protein NRIC0766_15030 [Lactobacillus delbrueckii subsp. sunkii]GHN14052.1 hypothetical protein NRIC0767_03130 [Lactobacillus delbrueckii subsp. sunkii]